MSQGAEGPINHVVEEHTRSQGYGRKLHYEKEKMPTSLREPPMYEQETGEQRSKGTPKAQKMV